MKCSECARTFKPSRIDQVFCSVRCNAVFESRASTRARRLYRALYHWRNSRDDSRDLGFVCREIAHWREEDRLHQRGKPPRHNHMMDRGHQRKPVS